MKSLIVLEFKEEVQYLLRKRADLFNSDALILSLLPEASVILAEHNRPYITSLEFFSKHSHEKCLKQVDEICQKIDPLLDIKDNNGTTQAYNNTLCFYLRLYLSYVLFVIETVSNACKKYSITHIYGFRYQNNDFSSANIENEERFLGDVLENFNGLDVQVTLLNLKIKGGLLKRITKYTKRLVKAFLGVIDSITLRTVKEPSIVFYSLQYNLESIAREMKDYRLFNLMPAKRDVLKFREKREGFVIDHLHISDWPNRADGLFRKSFRATRDRVQRADKENSLFSLGDIDFADVIFRKWDHGYHVLFRKLNKRIAKVYSILQCLKPLVVISALSRELSFVLGELTAKLNIPSILISHGSHVPPKNEFDRRAWLDHGEGLIDTDYQYHLLQSPWARAYVQAVSHKKEYRNIFPVIFQKVDRSHKTEKQIRLYPQSRGKRIIIHASTPKSRRAMRFYVYETLDEYIENIKDLIEATRDNRDVFLIIRFRPSIDLSTEDLVRLLPPGEHYIVATEGKFSDYLEIADLLVSFSSTTIEEALFNKVPVLQYDRTGRYMHLEGASWKEGAFDKRDSVYWIGNRHHLNGALDWIMKHHFNEGSEAMFDRHVFAPDEAQQAEELIASMAGAKR